MTYNRAKLVKQLGGEEGRRLRVYLDTAKPPRRTIGIGRNLDAVGIRPAETKALGITLAGVIAHGITDAQCDALCSDDIDVAESQLDAHLPWWRKLDDVRQRVLLDLCFNMGIGTLLAFRSTLAAVQAGRFAAAAASLRDSRWNDQVGDRAKTLERMMATGNDA